MELMNLTKTVHGQTILRGINAREFLRSKPAGKTCECGQHIPPLQLSDSWVEPIACNDCRVKEYEGYIAKRKADEYSRMKIKCGGYANLPVRDDNEIVYYENLFEFPTQEKVLDHIAKFLEGEEKRGLYLFGEVGTGKSFLMKVLINELIRKYENVCFIKSVELVDLLHQACSRNSSYKPEQLVREFKNVDVLVVDDLGAEKGGDFIIEKFFQIFDYRNEHLRPTFFTSNVSIDKIKVDIDRRLGSRLGNRKWLRYLNLGQEDLRKKSKSNQESLDIVVS